MSTEFKLPELGEKIESGDLVRLMIKPGASITEGEPVMELETDKAVVEVPSSVTGTIGEVRVKEGDKLRVGQVIFTVENGSGAGTAKPVSKTVAATPPSVAPVSPTSPQPASTPAPRADRRAKPAAAAATEFKLPELGENIDSGDLVRLLIAPGTAVSEGQPVMELETDKAVIEVPSTVSGVVRELKVKEGQKVKVGAVIFTLEGGAVARSNMSPSSTELGSPSTWPCALRVRPKNRRCRPINPNPSPHPSPCRSNSAKSPALNIAIPCPPRRMCVVWHAKSESTFTASQVAAPVAASAKMM
jgi:pyruvate dehydrogenase E2 component (dihydrolipoamide acetyltransferase)